MPYHKRTRDEHFQSPGRKRILALDGGGLRGILSLAFLGHIEALLRARHDNDPDFRLCDYFDLVAGTSTGAIIAAALAKGMSVEEIVEQYGAMGHKVFKANWFRKGLFRARYDEKALIKQLKTVLGRDTALGGPDLRTGLLVVTKRMDTGSPWPVSNNPKGRYYEAKPDDEWISNADYPLWKVVRASTAAPSFFDPERITILREKGRSSAVGTFVDGGVSPFNNPALQAFMFATLSGYEVRWETGADQLLIVSIGTGSPDPSRAPAKLAATDAVSALMALMDDCASLVETMMQWMSDGPSAREIDSDLGDLRKDVLGAQPLFHYLRYDQALTKAAVKPLKPDLSGTRIKSLSAMDKPDNLGILKELGELAAAQQVRASDFPSGFDL